MADEPGIDSALRFMAFLDAHAQLGEGVPGTFGQQNAALEALIRHEAGRSAVFRELLGAIAAAGKASERSVAVTFLLGKNSCAFVDSFATWCLDSDDLTGHFPPDGGAACGGTAWGISRGEILVHILEERLAMRHTQAAYVRCHIDCFREGSYQNRYRRELGARCSTLMFSIGEWEDAGSICEFVAVEADGCTSTVAGIPLQKNTQPLEYAGYAPCYELQLRTAMQDPAAYCAEMEAKWGAVCKNSLMDSNVVGDNDKHRWLYWVGRHVALAPELSETERVLRVAGPWLAGSVLVRKWNELRTQVRLAPSRVAALGALAAAGGDGVLRDLALAVDKQLLRSESAELVSRWRSFRFAEYPTFVQDGVRSIIDSLVGMCSAPAEVRPALQATLLQAVDLMGSSGEIVAS